MPKPGCAAGSGLASAGLSSLGPTSAGQALRGVAAAGPAVPRPCSVCNNCAFISQTNLASPSLCTAMATLLAILASSHGMVTAGPSGSARAGLTPGRLGLLRGCSVRSGRSDRAVSRPRPRLSSPAWLARPQPPLAPAAPADL